MRNRDGGVAVRELLFRRSPRLPGRLLLAALLWIGAAGTAPVPASAAILTHGPVVGGVTDTSAKIFARTNQVAQIAVRYGPDPNLAGALTTGPTGVAAQTDFTGILTLTGLVPNTRYFVSVLVDGQDALQPPYPSFRTFPPPGVPAEFQVAVIGDTGNQGGGEPHGMGEAFRSAGREGAVLMIQVGDFDHRDPKTLEAKRTVRRDLYDSSISADFVALTRQMPFFYVWDDHDFGSNDSNGGAAFKPLSLQVYKEYVPSADLANPEGIWQKFRVGQAEFFLLDSRTQRSRNQDPDGPGKSMLDAFRIPNDQKQWLKEGLRTSTAVWKVVLSSSVWNPTLTKSDSWSSFQTEQRELLDFIAAEDLRNIVTLSGDVHWGAIDDGTHGGVPQLVVPNTNMTNHHQHRYGSIWSHGTYGIPEEDGVRNGYGTLTFLTNPHRLRLEVKSESGITQRELTITASVPPEEGQNFYTITPCRVVDTRNPDGPRGGPAMTAMQQRDFPIGGHCGIPPTARSVAFNVTVTASADSGHLQLYPSGSPPPATSTINWGMGQTRANNQILALGASGSVTAFCVIPSGSLHLILDVVGYFE